MRRAVVCLVTLFLAPCAWMTCAPARAEPIAAAAVQAIDGDTIAVRGAARSVRLVGFDAPERFHPRCADEAALAELAAERLAALIREEPLDLAIVACACPPGTQGTRDCNYGRGCGVLRSRERDVGTVLITEGLAMPYRCGPTGCPRREPRWCGGSAGIR